MTRKSTAITKKEIRKHPEKEEILRAIDHEKSESKHKTKHKD